MKKFVIMVNGGLYWGDEKKNVFSWEEVEKIFKKWSGGVDLVKMKKEVDLGKKVIF